MKRIHRILFGLGLLCAVLRGGILATLLVPRPEAAAPLP